MSENERKWTLAPSMDRRTKGYPLVTDGPMLDPGEEVAVVPATSLEGAVHLTDQERERVRWWLSQPVVPGPMKALDEAILRKLDGGQ